MRAKTVGAVLGAVAFVGAAPAGADGPTTAPSESVLGTVEVTGSATTSLPKLALVPLDESAAERAIVARDLDMLGAFDVVADAPAGPFFKDDPIDQKAWRAKGISMLVRVSGSAGTLHGDAWLLGKGDDPLYIGDVAIKHGDTRRAAHELSDAIVGALTGRQGPFASRIAWTARAGKGRQVFTADLDAQSPSPLGVATDTALSPTFGPGGEIWFTVSTNFAPFTLVHGKSATPFPVSEPGSILSVAFSPDRSKMALGIMRENDVSKIFVGKADGTGLTAIKAGKFANRPVFGPLGKLAWVQNDGTQRVHVDGSAVSPAGFHASAPTFCDSPQGLFVVFTVGVGNGADLIATDTTGGGIRRLTQGFGSNAYPACSPDGRLVAFFSTGKGGKDPGMYVLPLSNPSRVRKLSTEYGESLAWAR
jgi:TolB protein